MVTAASVEEIKLPAGSDTKHIKSSFEKKKKNPDLNFTLYSHFNRDTKQDPENDVLPH